MSKVLTVFGATGKQGGSVVQTILADKKLSSEFTIRGVSRDINKPAAKELTAKGVDMVAVHVMETLLSESTLNLGISQANLSDADSLASAVQGSHTVFVVTNFWETMSAETEELQGRAVTNAAKAAGVQHIIFSALLNLSEASGGRLKHVVHFDSKARIAQYMRDSGVPCSFVWPGAFMDDFVKYIRKSGDDEYILALPVDGDKAQMPLFLAYADMGKFVKLAIANYPKYVGKDIFAAAGYLTPNQLMAEWSEATGKKGKYVQLPEDVFKSHMPPPAAQLIYENMLLMQDPGYFAKGELAPFLDALDEKPTTWKEFARANQYKW